MIHVAPCSCELHVRIRELEAELARVTRDRDLYIHDLEAVRGKLDTQFMWTNREKARAEKAEHDLATLAIRHDAAAALLRQSQARVAELEKKMWLYVLYVDKNTGGDGLTDEDIRAIIEKPLSFTESLEEHGFIEKVKPGPAIEGQEREAD